MKLEKVIAVRNSKTIYRDGSYVIKVFDEGYSKADILNEALNIARVEETGLPIPHVEEVTKIEGKWAIVTDYAEGKTIAQLMAENPDKKDEYLERFVDIQIEVQSKTCPMLNRLKEKMKRKIVPRRLQPHQRGHLPRWGELVRPGLGPCHPGQRQCRRRPHLPAVLAGRRH